MQIRQDHQAQKCWQLEYDVCVALASYNNSRAMPIGDMFLYYDAATRHLIVG